jgi:hypothetical protein
MFGSTKYPLAQSLFCFIIFLLLIFRFGASTARYATFLTVGVIGAELATNGLTDSLWEMNNRGRTYGAVDWSKFDPTDDEEEEEEEDDDDDDDE